MLSDTPSSDAYPHFLRGNGNKAHIHVPAKQPAKRIFGFPSCFPSFTLFQLLHAGHPDIHRLTRPAGLSMSQLAVVVSMRPGSYYTPQIEISNGGKSIKTADEITHVNTSIEQNGSGCLWQMDQCFIDFNRLVKSGMTRRADSRDSINTFNATAGQA